MCFHAYILQLIFCNIYVQEMFMEENKDYIQRFFFDISYILISNTRN